MKYVDLESFLTIILLLSTVIILIIWYIKGYDGSIDNKKRLYKLPNSLSTLDIGYLYYGEVRDKDVNALLLYLASNNYLRIEEVDNSFKIIKLKDYKNKDEVQIFFNELFKNNDVVLEKELFNHFYKVTDEIRYFKNDIKNHYNHYFYDNSIVIMINNLIIIFNLFLVTTIVYLETLGNKINIGLIITFLLFYIITYLPLKTLNNITRFVTRIFTLLCYFFILVVGFNLTNEILIINLLINILLLMFMNFINLYMPKRNNNGKRLYSQIKRFRNSIKNIDTIKLKELLKENKNYVFDIYPFAYTLGVSRNLINTYIKVDNKIPKYVKMINEKDVRKNFYFLSKVTHNLDRRTGDEYY